MAKTTVRDKIALNVIALDVRQGHLKWKTSDLARKAEVSRPLVYYHFGRSKKEMLKASIEVIAEKYYALSGPRRKLAKNGMLFESLRYTRGMLEKTPALAVFYQRWRFGASDLSRQLEAIELRYQNKLAEAFPRLSPKQILSLHAHLHGLVTAPFLSHSDLKTCVAHLVKCYPLE